MVIDHRSFAPKRVLQQVGVLLEMIRYEHTVFALPFGLSSLMVATSGRPSGRVLLWVIAATATARAAAMGFNRLMDVNYDRLNPRTRQWPLPSGQLARREAVVFVAIMAGLFILSCSQLNRLTLLLSPIALVVVFFYSLTKRFTAASHLFLGLALALAPVGAWIAATGSIAWPPVILAGAVLLWVAGFDIIYSCQDVEFDRRVGLFSVPTRVGIGPALVVARMAHLATLALLVGFGWVGGLGTIYFAGILVVAGLLAYEHSLVRSDDLSRVNVAFFTVNGIVSMLVLVATCLDLWIS